MIEQCLGITRELVARDQHLGAEQQPGEELPDRDVEALRRGLRDHVVFAESDEGINCLAAPVLHAGTLVAVLWISGPSKRFPKSAFPEAAKHVMAAAREIGEKLGAP